MNDGEPAGRTGDGAQTPDLSIVLPAFNEAESFEHTVDAVLAALPTALTVQLIFVNDGSSDETLSIMRRLESMIAHPVVVVDRPTNGGLGWALASGFSAASGSIVTWLPGDGEYDLTQVAPAFSMLDEVDVVLARRTSRGQPGRSLVSSAMYLLLAVLFRFDARGYCGIFVIDRARFEALGIGSRDVFFTLELAIRCHRSGARIGYVELEWRPRQAGRSKVFNPITVLKNIAELFRFRVALWRSG